VQLPTAPICEESFVLVVKSDLDARSPLDILRVYREKGTAEHITRDYLQCLSQVRHRDEGYAKAQAYSNTLAPNDHGWTCIYMRGANATAILTLVRHLLLGMDSLPSPTCLI
jgi:hypothetical protein